jgi:(2R)-sulfolactate sulfo-lyase subunit alpha
VGQGMPHAFLIHREGDHVGVVVRDVAAGELLEGLAMDTGARLTVEARQDIPLGHKIALRDLPRNSAVVEYHAPIGVATKDIRAGEWVHIHNIRSARW